MSKIIPYFSTLLILIFFSLLILGTDYFGFLSSVKRAGYFLTNPITVSLYSGKQKLDRQFFFIFAARFAAQENKALKEQVAQVLSENAQLKKQLAETQTMLAQQHSLDPATYDLVPARPVGLERYLKVDKGSQDNIREGQAVVFKDNFVGQVKLVQQRGASIKLLTDPDSKVAAFSLDKDGKAKGVVIGQFGLEMLMDKILHEEPIEKGDLVYSEGTEGFLPRGLILGRVSEILEKKNEIFKQAKLKSVFDIKDLDLVFVIGE